MNQVQPTMKQPECHNSPPMFRTQIPTIQMKEQEKSFQEKIFFLNLGHCGVE